MLRPKSARVDPVGETIADWKEAPITAPGTFAPNSSPTTPPGTSTSFEVFFPAGKLIGHRYEIVRLVGRGGMGAVYEAKDLELERKVAIKVIRDELASEPEVLRRFKQELITARQVSHRNVVRIFDLGESEGTKFITMEFVEGVDLCSLLQERGAFSLQEAVDVLRQACAGVEAAHAEGVIHRDLKPANIMLSENGRVHVMDFGIARSAGSVGMTQTGAVLGTLEYMAPEQAKGEATDQRSDVYALGLIFYELLTGAQAFQADTPFGSLYQRTQGLPPDPDREKVTVPLALKAVLFRMLQVDPAKRYQTAAEVLTDLQAWQSGTAVAKEMPRPASAPAAPRHFRMNRRAVAVLMVILFVAAAGLLAFRLKSRPTRTPGAVKAVVADFRNETGDPVFAGTLEPTMSVDLEGAPFISLFNRGQARKAAQQLKPGSEDLDHDLARLVASREGVQVVISGNIANAADGYRVSVRAVDAITGKVIGHKELIANSKDEVLPTIAKLAAYVRTQLGDSTPPSLQLTAAETFTAASLESAHEYGQAQDLQLLGKSADAIEHYKKAVSLDPNMGRAYAGLAVAYSNLKRKAEAEENYRKAMALLDRMSERERYRTLGAYYLTYVNNYPKAIETYKKLVELYPSDSAGHNNLSIAYVFTLRMKDAVASVRRALEINPGNLQHRLNLSLYSMYAADFGTSIDEAKKVIAQNPKYEFAFLPLASSSLASGDEAAARSAYTTLAGLSDQGRSMSQIGTADVDMFRGRYQEAIRTLKAGIAADQKQKMTGEMAQKHVALAQAYLAIGQRPSAVAAATSGLNADSSESIVVPAAIILAEAGDVNAARAQATKLRTAITEQSRSYARLIDGVIALQQKNYFQAVTELQEAVRLRDSWLAHFWLARAYVEASHYAEAISELEICENRRGETTDLFFADTPTVRTLPLLYYWKAKAQAGLGLADAADKTRTYYASLRPQLHTKAASIIY
jgi:tetratricopeptide (TPR) repeat protein